MSVATELKERIEDFLVDPRKYMSQLSQDQCDELLENFGKGCEEAFIKQFMAEPRSGKPSASSLGKCARQLAYQYHGFEGEPMTAQKKMTFFTGDLLEAAIYAICEAAGWKILDIQKRTTVGDIGGSIDGKANPDTLVDIKTASKAAAAIAERTGVTDGFGYLTQMQIYREGEGVKDAFWLYVCKDNGKISVHEAEDMPDLVTMAKSKYDFILASTPDRLPPRPHALEINKKTKRSCLPFNCAYCDYKEHCWVITDKGEGYNNSVVYHATEPRD